MKIKIPHIVIVKAPGLLNMMYKASELAEDLTIPESTLRDWLEAGAPHHRDSREHIWIRGTEFAGWVESMRKTRAKQPLADDQAYCFRCRKVVNIENVEIRKNIGKLIHFKGICPDCGCKINRGGRSE